MKKRLLRIGLAVALLAVVAAGLFEVARSRTFQFCGGIVNHVDTQEKLAALTFDDGPSAMTDDILRTLDNEKVKATFFLQFRPPNGKKLVLLPCTCGSITGRPSCGHWSQTVTPVWTRPQKA